MHKLDIINIKKDDSLKLLFTGAIHGNEKCGTKAINKVIEMFNNGGLVLEKGSLTFIPICNPKAFEANIREIDANLNRVISVYNNPQTYEENISTQIAEEILKSDYMIDLHSSYTDDAPFAFLDYFKEGNRKLVDASCVKYVVSGFPEVYEECEDLSEMSTETFANTKAKINGITVECGNHYKKESEDFAYQLILNTLKIFNMIKGESSTASNVEYIHTKKMVLKKYEGAFSKEYQHMDEIFVGDVIAEYNSGEKIIAEYNSIILLPNIDAKIGHEWFYIGEKLEK